MKQHRYFLAQALANITAATGVLAPGNLGLALLSEEPPAGDNLAVADLSQVTGTTPQAIQPYNAVVRRSDGAYIRTSDPLAFTGTPPDPATGLSVWGVALLFTDGDSQPLLVYKFPVGLVLTDDFTTLSIVPVIGMGQDGPFLKAEVIGEDDD